MEQKETIGSNWATSIPDIFLVDKVKENDCLRSMKWIINRHSPLCMKIMKRYVPAMMATNSFSTDMYKEMNVLIYQSIISFDPNRKVKFSTWLGNQTRYFCLNKLNKSSKIKYLTVDSESIEAIADKEEHCPPERNEHVRDYIFNILEQMKDKRIKKVFRIRYFRCNRKLTPWDKIAKNMDVSTQTVINLHNRGKELLKKKLSSMNLEYMDRI